MSTNQGNITVTHGTGNRNFNQDVNRTGDLVAEYRPVDGSAARQINVVNQPGNNAPQPQTNNKPQPIRTGVYPPNMPKEMNPQYGPNGANPQYNSNGMNPQYVPNGVNPQYGPNGANPQYSPNGMNPQYGPNGSNPQYSPNGMNPQYGPNGTNPQYSQNRMAPPQYGQNPSGQMYNGTHSERKRRHDQSDPEFIPETDFAAEKKDILSSKLNNFFED